MTACDPKQKSRVTKRYSGTPAFRRLSSKLFNVVSCMLTRRLRMKLIESAGWSRIAFSTWTPDLRWQPRRPQAFGEMCGVRRVLVGPRPHVLIDSEIGIEPQRGRRQLGRADLIADPGVAGGDLGQMRVARRNDLPEGVDGVGVAPRAVKGASQ